MHTESQIPSPNESAGENVHLQIPIPELSTECDGRQIYHFSVIALVDQTRQYLASALAGKPYRLSDDAEYVDGLLRFQITSTPGNVQMDFLEAQRVYSAAARDVERALSYLDDPVGTVRQGLDSGRPKCEFQNLYKAAAELVKENEKSPIEAAVVRGSEVVSVTGEIASIASQRQAKRQLSPPVDYQLEKLILTFASRDSDGVLVTDQGELFDPGDAYKERIPLGEPTGVEAQVEKTRVTRDIRKITRLLDEGEEPDE